MRFMHMSGQPLTVLFELQKDLTQLFDSPLMEVVPKVSVATPGCGVALSRLSTWGRFGNFFVKLTEFLLQLADLILQDAPERHAYPREIVSYWEAHALPQVNGEESFLWQEVAEMRANLKLGLPKSLAMYLSTNSDYMQVQPAGHGETGHQHKVRCGAAEDSSAH